MNVCSRRYHQIFRTPTFRAKLLDTLGDIPQVKPNGIPAETQGNLYFSAGTGDY